MCLEIGFDNSCRAYSSAAEESEEIDLDTHLPVPVCIIFEAPYEGNEVVLNRER